MPTAKINARYAEGSRVHPTNGANHKSKQAIDDHSGWLVLFGMSWNLVEGTQ